VIDREEVTVLGEEYSLELLVVEKDYVLGWLLAGVAANPEFTSSWVFKGGTCLKKCQLETYRFSEDLDFTVTDEAQLDQDFLRRGISRIVEWVNARSGIEIVDERTRLNVSEFDDGHFAKVRVYFIGPLRQKRSLARIKFDLTSMERLVHPPESRAIHHVYSDSLDGEAHVECYRLEEILAEKIRALADRKSPRDLYDIMHLYRNACDALDRGGVHKAIGEKCEFKNTPIPIVESFQDERFRTVIETDWRNMLDHQLPILPDPAQYLNEIPAVFGWLHGETEKPALAELPPDRPIDASWKPPSMCCRWHSIAQMELVRFAGANRLCVSLLYENGHHLIEPYALHRGLEGELLLTGVEHATGQAGTYRADGMQKLEVSEKAFEPRFQVTLTPGRSGATESVQ